MSKTSFIYTARGESDTERLGEALARVLPPGAVVGLSGALGAGKTRLVQAIAANAGADRGDVVSPTFVLMHEYHGERPIYHIDTYRLRDEDEFLQLGADEYFAPPNLVFIEWPERVANCLPADRIEIRITVADDDSRQFEIGVVGTRYAELIEKLERELA